MNGLSDAAVARLAANATWPEFDGPRYTVVAELGRGGMGTVYRAVDTMLGRDVAVKVPRAFGDADSARRLQTEASVLARLEHPGIVPVHDVGSLVDGRLFYVMKLIEGETLRAWLDSVTDRGARLALFERICEPVAFAHARGFVHRDLKPDNIMLGPFGEVLVMDWGAARLVGTPDETEARAGQPDGASTATGAIGTHGFMPPEQSAGLHVDARADVYSLGAVLSLMLGDVPDTGGASSGAVSSRTDVPRALRSICARAMADSAGDRYPDAGRLGEDVRRFLSGQRVHAHPEGPFDRLARLGRTYRVAILLVAAYLVMRTLVAILGGR